MDSWCQSVPEGMTTKSEHLSVSIQCRSLTIAFMHLTYHNISMARAEKHQKGQKRRNQKKHEDGMVKLYTDFKPKDMKNFSWGHVLTESDINTISKIYVNNPVVVIRFILLSGYCLDGLEKSPTSHMAFSCFWAFKWPWITVRWQLNPLFYLLYIFL